MPRFKRAHPRPVAKRLVAEAELPQVLCATVLDVVKRTRLWRSENADVADELIAHFSDGLAAGRSAQTLVSDFGSPELTARLIRRAKRRQRPLAWRAWVRSVQGVGLLLGVVVVIYLYAAVRLFTGTPHISHDYLADVNAGAASVPPAEEAVVGSSIQPGEFIQCSGRWDNHRDHGIQFRTTFLKVMPPSSIEGIEKYLGSGMIKGIGPHFARKLVKAFGEDVFDVIESAPERLRELNGIGPKRVERITSGWADQKAIREIMVFLQSHGVGTSRAVRIYKTYGADAIPLVSENPYRLARDIKGIGFLTADQIAEKLGIEKTAMIRARAGISYTLTEAVSEGHCGLPEDDLMPMAEKLLEIPPDILRDALQQELQDETVVADTIGERRCIFLGHLWNAERVVAERLKALATGQPSWPEIDFEKAIPWVERKLGVTLAESQREAVKMAVSSKVMVITGGPGVGKTTLVNAILRILVVKGVSVALAAPTGRAAKRLSESTGMEAKTIHRLLEVDPRHGGFKRGVDNPLECDLLIVDETSMVDVPLMAALVKALPDRAALMVVGDVDQLPSVGPGQVLADIIDSGAVPVARLTEIFRQAAESQIVTNAHKVNAGYMPNLDVTRSDKTDFYFVEARDPEDGVSKIIEIVKNRLPKRFGFDPIKDVQVLCPMNRGGLGARSLNVELQKALNPPVDEVFIERFGFTYRVGDKVMQTDNDYDKEVFNGDVGYVRRIDPDSQELVIEFDDKPVEYQFGELDEVALAY
ncbi:MAG: ATP-dependent RecD-like DNA helicase, partial [Planctomycetes bacterium]|nr:ATP-dependent RecD-like DNA helicase [Planctomycetota bacterium]